LTVDNTSLAVIGFAGDKGGKKKLESFKLYDGQDVGPILEANLESTATEEDEPAAAAGGDAMETDS
jgi:20S proteasome subunit alpha 6